MGDEDLDGTTHVLFEPLDFIARLAALVPLPRMHLWCAIVVIQITA